MIIPYIAPEEESLFKTKYDLVPLLQSFLRQYCVAISPDTDIQDMLSLTLLERAFLITTRQTPNLDYPFDWMFFQDIFDVTEEGLHQASHIYHTEPTTLFYEELILLHEELSPKSQEIIGLTYGFYDGEQKDPIEIMFRLHISTLDILMSYTEFFRLLLDHQKRK